MRRQEAWPPSTGQPEAADRLRFRVLLAFTRQCGQQRLVQISDRNGPVQVRDAFAGRELDGDDPGKGSRI